MDWIINWRMLSEQQMGEKFGERLSMMQPTLILRMVETGQNIIVLYQEYVDVPGVVVITQQCMCVWRKVTDVTPPQGLDRNCLMCLVMTDSSLVICAESNDDMRFEMHSFRFNHFPSVLWHGSVTGRAYMACKKDGLWFVGDDDLTGALHML